jgi:hypothetical protein
MRLLQVLVTLFATLALAGCEVIGTIFEAGMWVGVILVLVIVGIVGFVISRFRR